MLLLMVVLGMRAYVVVVAAVKFGGRVNQVWAGGKIWFHPRDGIHVPMLLPYSSQRKPPREDNS